MADADVEAVTAVLEEFYAAFERLDMDRMADCWSHDDSVRVVWAICDLIACLGERTHHNLAVDEILRAPETDKSNFFHLLH